MKIANLALLLSLLLAPAAFAKGECSYCEGMDKLKTGFSKVKPDAMNAKTIDRQNELVDESSDLLKAAMKSPAKLSADDWKRILPFLAIVVQYDYQNLVADEVLPVMGKGRDVFFAELKKSVKAGLLKQAEADEILVSFGTAEAIQERGSDED